MRFTMKRYVLLSGWLARALARTVELTPQRADLLLAIRFGPLSIKDVASELGVTPPVISRMVRALIQLRLVEKQIPARDRRVRLIAITKAGRRTLECLFEDLIYDDGHETVQAVAEEELLADWWPVFENDDVSPQLLSGSDQRELLERIQPIIRRTIYPCDERWFHPKKGIYHWEAMKHWPPDFGRA